MADSKRPATSAKVDGPKPNHTRADAIIADTAAAIRNGDRVVLEAWRQPLATRIKIATLRFEATGLGREEIVALGAEVELFRETKLYFERGPL